MTPTLWRKSYSSATTWPLWRGRSSIGFIRSWTQPPTPTHSINSASKTILLPLHHLSSLEARLSHTRWRHHHPTTGSRWCPCYLPRTNSTYGAERWKFLQMEIPTQDGFIKLQARGAILEPQHPFFVTDRAVPRSGTQVDRYFRYTRSSDGTIFVWLARRSGQGRGSGWSGLRFDLVQKLGAS
jgi:hypothetical protein